MSLVQEHEDSKGYCPKCKRPFGEEDLAQQLQETLYAEQPVFFECECGAELTFKVTITWSEVLS